MASSLLSDFRIKGDCAIVHNDTLKVDLNVYYNQFKNKICVILSFIFLKCILTSKWFYIRVYYYMNFPTSGFWGVDALVHSYRNIVNTNFRGQIDQFIKG